MPILDLTQPSVLGLNQAVAFIKAHVGTGCVYVHCALGYSRSATVIAAYLLSVGISNSIDEAVARIRAVRPEIVMQPEQLKALEEYRRTLHQSVRSSGLPWLDSLAQ